jgi:hypothetical protein
VGGDGPGVAVGAGVAVVDGVGSAGVGEGVGDTGASVGSGDGVGVSGVGSGAGVSSGDPPGVGESTGEGGGGGEEGGCTVVERESVTSSPGAGRFRPLRWTDQSPG